MSKISINGVTIEGDFSGRSIVVQDGNLRIDGKNITLPDEKIINVEVHGDAGDIQATTGDVTVSGKAFNIKTQTGDVRVGEHVDGDITTQTGDVKCGYVTGSVRTMTGVIRHEKP